MSKYTDFINFAGDRNYERDFWDAMRGKAGARERLSDNARDYDTGTYRLPEPDEKKLQVALKEKKHLSSARHCHLCL